MAELNMSIYEISMAAFAVFIFIAILSGIFIVTNPDFIHTKTVLNEATFVSSLMEENTNVNLNADPKKTIIIETDSVNKINAKLEDAQTPLTKSYIGEEKGISSIENTITIS